MIKRRKCRPSDRFAILKFRFNKPDELLQASKHTLDEHPEATHKIDSRTIIKELLNQFIEVCNPNVNEVVKKAVDIRIKKAESGSNSTQAYGTCRSSFQLKMPSFEVKSPLETGDVKLLYKSDDAVLKLSSSKGLVDTCSSNEKKPRISVSDQSCIGRKVLGTLTDLTELRKSRKGHESWKHYIKQLRLKHGIPDAEELDTATSRKIKAIAADNRRSKLSEDITKIVKEMRSRMNSYDLKPKEDKFPKTRDQSYNKDSFCYVTASNGRKLWLQKQKQEEEEREKWRKPHLKKTVAMNPPIPRLPTMREPLFKVKVGQAKVSTSTLVAPKVGSPTIGPSKVGPSKVNTSRVDKGTHEISMQSEMHTLPLSKDIDNTNSDDAQTKSILNAMKSLNAKRMEDERRSRLIFFSKSSSSKQPELTIDINSSLEKKYPARQKKYDLELEIMPSRSKDVDPNRLKDQSASTYSDSLNYIPEIVIPMQKSHQDVSIQAESGVCITNSKLKLPNQYVYNIKESGPFIVSEPNVAQTSSKSHTTLSQDKLSIIELKLDGLLDSLQSFLFELKRNRLFPSSQNTPNTSHNTPNIFQNSPNTSSGAEECTRKEAQVRPMPRRLSRIEELVCGLALDRVDNKFRVNTSVNSARIEELVCDLSNDRSSYYNDNLMNNSYKSLNYNNEEIELNNLLNEQESKYLHSGYKRDNIDFQIPSRDTYYTESLVKKPNTTENIQEIKTFAKQEAVNTDPLSITGLIRLSAETVKNNLLPYLWAHSRFFSDRVPMLTFPSKASSSYVCDICGATFNKLTLYSNHVERHYHENPRDCNICRHLADARVRPSQQTCFRCRCCGKQFTRAYCCELHQATCAKRLGIATERASLLLLQ